jgi:hypothetical protein
MISLFDTGPKNNKKQHLLKRVYLRCSKIFSYIERNEKNFALITGSLILITFIISAVKSFVVLLRAFDIYRFDIIYKFVESHLIIFESPIFILKLITVAFVFAFVGKYGLAKFVEPMKTALMKLDEEYERIRESVNNTDFDQYHRLVDKTSYSVDLDTIADLGWQAFGEENISKDERRHWFEELWLGNNEVFSLILHKDTKKPIGYVCILPLEENDGSNNYQGQLSQFHINQKAISKSLPAKYVFWQAVYLKDEYQDDTRYISVLTRLLFLKTKKFINQDSGIIYAESFTTHGTKILLRFGFKSTNVFSYQKHEIFSIQLNDANLNLVAKHNLELIKKV